MIGLAISASTNDLHLVGDNLATVTDAHAVGQHARQRLKTHKGEWFLDTVAGVPWLDEILGRGYDPALGEAVIKDAIAGTYGVTEITSFSIRFNASQRELEAYSITVETIYDQGVQV